MQKIVIVQRAREYYGELWCFGSSVRGIGESGREGEAGAGNGSFYKNLVSITTIEAGDFITRA